jgi:AraC-like DNA-binding protein
VTGLFKPWFRYAKKYRYNRRFFRKSLILMLLLASVPGLIIGASIYGIATSKLENELQRLHHNQIVERAANVDDQLSYLELTFSHWAFDPKFDDKLKSLDIAQQFEQVQELYRTLFVMEGSHPLLQTVELYLEKPAPIVFNKNQYTRLQDQAAIQPYEALLQEKRPVFWTYRPHAGGDGAPGGGLTLSLVNKIPGGSTEPFGIIVADVNSANLMKLVKTLTPYNEGETMLMAEDGRWQLSSGGDASADIDAALRKAVKQRQAASDSFLFDYRNKTYSVSYGRFSRLGASWVYVSAAPLTEITSPVVAMSKRIVYISLSGLALALIMSWLVSRRIYSPIERLVRLLSGERGTEHKDEFDLLEKQWNDLSRESATLRSKLDEQLPLLREGFFLQLAQGYLISYQENDIRERMKHYGWNAENRKFAAIVFQLTGFSNVMGRFSPGDEDLVTFAAANIIEEMTGTQYEQAGVINFHDFSVGLLLSFPEDHPTGWLDRDLDSFCQEAAKTIHQILRMQVTIAISRWTEAAKQIPELFEEARQALLHRDLFDDNQIIRAEQLAGAGPYMESNYPFTLEKEIIHHLRNGMEDETMDLIRRFMRELSEGGGSTELVVQQGMLQLLAAIRYAVLQSGMNPVRLFGGVNVFEHLSQIKEPEEMMRWFRHKVVRVFVQELIGRQDFHLKQMVENVIVYLREHYMTMLSLDSCAEKFGTSPYTLSRAFKQMTGINFIDYLTQIRIDQSKTLLRETDYKINDVAERVGYQHTYFNRIFKKYEGITPSQYRELHRP